MIVSPETTIAILDLMRRSNIEELADMEDAGSATSAARQCAELVESLLAIITASVETHRDPVVAIATFREVSLSVTGLFVRAQHDNREPCQRCFSAAISTVIRELTQAMRDDASEAAAEPAPSLSTIRH